MNSRAAVVAAGIALALLATGLRTVHLGADPPYSIEVHSPFSIEGQIVHNARSHALFGRWTPDSWDLTALSAVPTFLSAASFSILGTSLAGARAPAIVLSLLSMLLFFSILTRGFGSRTAVLGTLLLATNYAAAMIMRLALPATAVMTLMLLAVWFWGWRSRPIAGAALAGIASAAAAASDTTGFVVVLAGAVLSLLLRLHAWKMTWLREARSRVRAYWTCLGAGLALWVFALVIPHWTTTAATFRYTNPFPDHLREILRAGFFSPHELGGLFRLFPVTVLVIAVYSLFFSREVMRLIARHRPVAGEKLWLFAWLLAGLLFVGVLQSRPMRTLLFLIPPMVAFAADGLLKLASLRRIERIEIGLPVFFFWETTVVWFGVQWAFRAWLLMPKAPVPAFFRAHANRWEFAVVTLLSLGISFVAVLAYRRWRHARFDIPIPRAVSVTVVVAAVAAILAIDLAQYERWRRHPHDSVLEAQAAVAALPGTEAVAGTWAPLLCLPSRHPAIMVREGMNEAPMEKLGVRYLLLEKGTLEDLRSNALLARLNADLPRRAVLRGTFVLGAHEVELFELPAPAPMR
jgi:4-amino-4-deoxy-L-arabinose transferase-like glycosyltransferase